MSNNSLVDTYTFLTDSSYLGNTTLNGKRIYPYWKDKINKIFNNFNIYDEVIMHGALGIGRTFIYNICVATILYNIMSMENPHEYFNLDKNDKITILYIKDNQLDLSEPTIFHCMQQSPWFMTNGKLTNDRYETNNNIIVKYSDTINSDEKVIVVALDEANYVSSAFTDLYKIISKQVRNNFPNFGKSFLISASKNKNDFINTYIRTNNIDKTLIINDPQWIVKPSGTFGKDTFKVAIPRTDKNKPEIVKDMSKYDTSKYRYINVPIELKPDFELDIYRALTDYAGITLN